VDAFVKTLRNFVRIPIHLQDERYSTAEAESLLMPLEPSREERKKVVDSLAAALFLQTYLDETRTKAARQEPSS
jgi:putative Holliday junction resolvase